MRKSICILFCLLALGCALNSINQTYSSSRQNTSKVGVTNSGYVPLYKNARGFYAGVDLIRDDSTWPYFGPNSVAMELGLYTSQTLLVSNCLGFSKYNCQRYQCSKYSWIYAVHYPYFVATANTASAQVYLDYSHWNLKDYALLATSCTSQGSGDYGSDGMSGIIGLGLINQVGVNNYWTSNPVFSLYLRPANNLDGYLMFEKDLRFAASSQSVAKWKTDKNWNASISGYIQVGGSASFYVSSVSLILDAATNITGFPSSIYSSVVRSFSYAGIQCTGEKTRPTCSYGSYKSRLPTISISLSYPSSGSISLPPEIYVVNYSSYSNQTFISSFTLNMKALGSGLTQENYVTPSFDNTIILSSDVLSQYYIVFDGSNSYNPSISFYTASKNPPVPGSIPWWGFVVGGVILAGLICACCRCCYRPKVINVRTSPGAPLILNDQTQYIQPIAPVINYSYPQPIYTQQPQIIVQPQPQVIVQQPQAIISQQPQGFYNAPPQFNYN